MADAVSRRHLYIWLPCLSLDRCVRADDPRLDGPFATTRQARGAFRIVDTNRHAREAGVVNGAALADARALCPDLLSEPVVPSAEAALLRALRRWCDRFTPSVALDAPSGLHLDVSGAAHLFGGEGALLEQLRSGLEDLRITARIAVAGTHGLAKAWAMFGEGEIVPAGETRAWLGRCPVEVFGPDTAYKLRRLGLRRVAQLYDFSSLDIAKRFGVELQTALDRMLGRQAQPLALAPLTRPFATRMTLPEPILHIEAVQGLIGRLYTGLLARLEREGLGARSFGLSLWGPDGDAHSLDVGFARPTRDVDAVSRQFARPLEGLSLPFGTERLRLEARDIAPVQARQISLDEDAGALDAVDQLVTVLGNRVGFDRVRRPAPSQSHLPDRECASVSVREASHADWPVARSQRPLRLFAPERVRTVEPGDPPRRFEWRRTVYDRAGVSKPERISPEWWSEDPGPLRDYWRVDTQQGRTLWLASNPTLPHGRDWSVAGVFA